MAVLLASSGVSGRAKHADMPASARASRLTRHGGEAAACRATPMCRLALRADRCRTLLSCLPHLPPLALQVFAPGNCGPVARLHQQPAHRRTRRWPQASRVRGKTPARGTAAPEAARSAARMRSHCTRDDMAIAVGMTRRIARQDARRRAANRRPSWARLQPDRARDADHGGCTDRSEIPAVE